jgi:hypothetical protein
MLGRPLSEIATPASLIAVGVSAGNIDDRIPAVVGIVAEHQMLAIIV